MVALPSSTVSNSITACFNNIAIAVAFQRDAGILKRINGTPLPGWAFLASRVVHAMLVGAASFCALGLAITAAMPNADAANAIVFATIMPLLFLSDIVIPFGNSTPDWILWIARIFPVRHFAQGMQAGFLGTPFHWIDVLIPARYRHTSLRQRPRRRGGRSTAPNGRRTEDAMNAMAMLTRGRLAVLVSVFGPPLLCLAIVPFRGSVANTEAALLLVVVIVGVAALGNRLAGWLAGLSAGIWFDFFLTKPYEHFTITSRDDIETTVLLLIVGAAVTELAMWARREQALAARQSGYLEGLHQASEVAVTGTSPTKLMDRVCEQLIALLALEHCRFHYGTGIGNPRLEHDGTLTWGDIRWDVDREGFPGGRETELLVSSGGRFWGRFMMTPAPGSRPDLTQRLAAIAMADQVGAALSEYRAEQG